MSTLPTNRGGSDIPVHINGVPFSARVLRIKLTQKENEHEMASLYVSSDTSTDDFSMLPSQRVEFTYGLMGTKNIFQGYVSHVLPIQTSVNGTLIQEQEIVCLGPSMIFKSNKPRFWDDTTATDAMRSIVAEQSLGFSNEKPSDTYRWRQIAQTSETDWEMLVNLADMIGCSVIMNRGVVRLIDYNDVAARQQPIRTFKQTNRTLGRRTFDADEPNMLLQVQAMKSSIRDPYFRSPQFSYLANGRSVSVVEDAKTATGTPALTQASSAYQARFATDRPVNTPQEADALLAGYYSAEWSQTASVRVTGDSMMQPCCIIRIDTRGNNPQRNVAYDGDWYVQSVGHNIWPDQYLVDLTLGRAVMRQANWYQNAAFWLGDKRGIPTLTFIGTGQWISSWR